MAGEMGVKGWGVDWGAEAAQSREPCQSPHDSRPATTKMLSFSDRLGQGGLQNATCLPCQQNTKHLKFPTQQQDASAHHVDFYVLLYVPYFSHIFLTTISTEQHLGKFYKHTLIITPIPTLPGIRPISATFLICTSGNIAVKLARLPGMQHRWCWGEGA